MKRKSILLTGLAGLSALSIVGATTLAGNTTNNTNNGNQINRMMGGRHMRGEGMKEGMGKGMGMMNNISETDREKIKNLSETDRETMMELVKNAIDAKDYKAFKDAHSKYGITVNMTEDEFNNMITKKAEMDTKRAEMDALREKEKTAIKNGDYETRKSLNADKPVLNYIDSKEKFTKLQEIHSYREKIESIAKELGLPQGKGIGMGMGLGKGNNK